MTILLEYDSTHVRIFFRVYFFVLFIAISMIGNKCCSAGAKLTVLKGQRVPFSRLTGWLQNMDPFTAIIRMRALPGGWLGLFMIASYFLNVGSDLVTTLVGQVDVQDRCPFGTGLVISSQPQPELVIPAYNGAPYFVVAQAQITSQANGGLRGVYTKANRDVHFSADTTDVLGGWVCTRNRKELLYPPDIHLSDIVANVQQAGLLYSFVDPPACYSISTKGLTSHLVILDTSTADDLGKAFDVRDSIDTSAGWDDVKVMQSYDCKLETTNATADLASIQSVISSRETISLWCAVIQGAVYDGTGTPASNNTQGILEEVLNSMIMVTGGGNYLLSIPAGNTTQGCITPRTYIPWAVVTLAAVVATMALLLLVFWHYLLTRIHFVGRRQKMELVESVKYTPGSIFTWMVEAVRESHNGVSGMTEAGAKVVKLKHLGQWDFGEKADGSLGVARRSGRSENVEEHMLLPHAGFDAQPGPPLQRGGSAARGTAADEGGAGAEEADVGRGAPRHAGFDAQPGPPLQRGGSAARGAAADGGGAGAEEADAGRGAP
jgi:hypothetical protein